MVTKPAHVQCLRTAVRALHDRGFVHGDLREPNILLVMDQVMLLDFDWCGPEGVARYPSDISMKGEDPIP
jgi:tRNA A-37 threonylcarbamoyl transferase component Bud32